MSWIRIAMACAMILGLSFNASAQIKLDPNAQYRTVADVLFLIDHIKPDPALVASSKAMLEKPLPPVESSWSAYRDALLERMDAAEALGNIKLRLEAADAVMALFRQRKDRYREMEYAYSYAGILRESGQDAKAYALEEEMVKDPKTYARWVLAYHYRRASRLADAGDLQAAQPHYDAFIEGYKRVPGYSGVAAAAFGYEDVQASFKRAQGKYVEAEVHYLNALKESQKWIDSITSIASWGRHALPSNRAFASYLSIRLNYSQMLLDRGRVADAERVARQPLLWSLERMGKYSPHAVRASAAYANVLGSQGRHIEAEKLARISLEIAAGIGVEPESSFIRVAQQALARALLGQGKVSEADAAFEVSTASSATAIDPLRALAAILNGRAAGVVQVLQTQADRVTSNIGAAGAKNSALVGEALALHAMALGALATDSASRQAAIMKYRSAVTIMLAARAQSGASEDALRVLQREWMLQRYLMLLSEQPEDAQSIADSFVVADWLRGSSTQGAVAASAARAAVNDSLLASTVRREQDMRTELVNLNRSMQRLSTLSPEQLKEAGEDPTVLRQRIDALVSEQSRMMADITKRFPKYSNLIQPQPPTTAQTQSVLKPDEVLVSILSTLEHSFIWAVPAQGPVIFRRSALGERDIGPLVKALRNALDVGAMPPARWPQFDTAASHRLYRELFDPVKAALSGASTMIVAANGSLASLPPAVLVTAEHTLGKDSALPFDRYINVPWLAKQYGIAQVPSVSALVSLRQTTNIVVATKAFIGFGDPIFSSQQTTAPAHATRNLRSAAITRPDQNALRSNQSVNWTPYSKLAPLPDTRDEVIAIAKALGADPLRDVILGSEVTKQRIQQTNLSDTRIVAFATHGLLAGDFPGINQPALALSVPAGKDADKNPIEALLTLEDVLQLKLNADWVILSACNTAAADGNGSEAVSGLGRGFFYAGSKALLVTHWSVDSESAKDLVSHIFSSYASSPPITRSTALREAMTHIRSSSAKDAAGLASHSLAHPLFWAPYALVGEPAR